jgi:hypothetical protein
VTNSEAIHSPYLLGGRKVVPGRTRDAMMTFDEALRLTQSGLGDAPGKKLKRPETTHDGRTVDSTGAFLVGELERLDQTLHDPLASVTWGRDVDLREDVTIADEISSYTISTYASAGGLGAGQTIGNSKAWMGKNTDQITGIDVDIAKIPNPLTPWAIELKYTILELESAARLGRPVDQQKYEGLQLKHQMDIDEQVYVGDTTLRNQLATSTPLITGLLNTTSGTQEVGYNAAVATVSGNTTWASKIAAGNYVAVATDVNTLLSNVWANSAWAVIPDRLLIPPTAFGLISTSIISTAGNVSILKYIQENNILTTSGRGKLTIFPCKWCQGVASGGTIGTGGTGFDIMCAYTKDKKRVRYPMTLLQRTPVQYDGMYHKTTYFCRLGALEIPYPETIGYGSGLS